ncbi:MAG: hypothetical protein E7517_09645 [Ruminococcaceae bacterium]|nr:hypothetical protein [Oscillospiraceae bacterium]
MAQKTKNQFLMYKGHPLVRSGNTLYYGFMDQSHVVMLTILSTKKAGDVEIADKVRIQLIATDITLNPLEAMVKTSEKNGLFEALDLASIWLERALKK